MDVKDVASLLRLLGDGVRLRLLRVLAREALNVSELTAVLGIAQSGVSRHLGLLREAELVVEERAGGFAWYRLAPSLDEATDPRNPLWTWLRRRFEAATADTAADDARLEEVRRLRKEQFVTHGAGAVRGQLVPGRSWAAWARALGLLLPRIDVVDLGCGEGYLTIEAAAWARKVVAVDQSDQVLARARALARRRRVTNIAWKRGRMERAPVRAASADLVLLSQAIHHADDPALVLVEASRILRPGGRVLVLDLREHQEAWVTRALGDRWLGFTEDGLGRLLRQAAFRDVVVRVGAREPGDPFVVLIAAGVKGAAAKTRRSA